MKTIRTVPAILAMFWLLTACGGGTPPGDSNPLLQSHPATASAGPLAAMATPARRFATVVRTPDVSSFFNWAELAYPSLFEAPQSNQSVDVWTYRYYPKTDIYLGTNTTGDVLGLVGNGGGQYNAVALGRIADFGCLVYPSDCVARQVTVSTVAGADQRRLVDGIGASASFVAPTGVAIDSVGNAYVADNNNNVIRKTTPGGVVTTLAGNGSVGFVNGSVAASFAWPRGVAVDSAGNVYVADTGNHAIRKITPAGQVATLAGNGDWDFSNGTGGAASFRQPHGVAVDSVGNVYVADSGNHAIRKISPDGVVTTFAGNGTAGFSDGIGAEASFNAPQGVAVDGVGNVYVSDTHNNAVRKISPTGGVTTMAGDGSQRFVDGTAAAATFNGPTGITVDSTGTMYVADSNNHAIRRITPTGEVTTLAGNGAPGSSDGTVTTAKFNYPEGVATDSAGNLYVADVINGLLRKITPAGLVSTLAGHRRSGFVDGTAPTASFASPGGVAVDSAGNLYVADSNNNAIRKSTPLGVLSTLAGNGSEGFADGLGADASFRQPFGVAVDSTGNVYVADTFNGAIRKITAAGEVTTLAANGFDDGTGTTVRLSGPRGVAVDVAGNVYVADTYHDAVRKITPLGQATTIAGSGLWGFSNGTGAAATFDGPEGVAVDMGGNVYVADTSNHAIRKITPGGVVTTLAGNGNEGFVNGTGAAASFSHPSGVAVDSAGNVYVADSGNQVIRKITPTGVVTTLAGNGSQGFADGTGSVARFSYPNGVAVDSAGNVYVADFYNAVIRKIVP